MGKVLDLELQKNIVRSTDELSVDQCSLEKYSDDVQIFFTGQAKLHN